MVIRKGTNTDRIDRADLDKIYEAKYSQKDRKTDLILSCDIIDDFVEFDNHKYKVKRLKLSAQNVSNQSISFLIELKVKKDSSFSIETSREIQIKIREYIASQRSLSIPNYNTLVYNWDAIKITDLNDFTLVSRVKNIHHEKEIIIPQKNLREDVFDENLILTLQEQKTTLNIEVKLSSDDFTSGPLIETFLLEVDK